MIEAVLWILAGSITGRFIRRITPICAAYLAARNNAFANTANSGGDQSGKSNNHDGEVSK